MRLPSIPVAAGRRLTNADIVITLHHTVARRDPEEVVVIDRPRFIAGYTPSYLGVLALEDVDVEVLKSKAQTWARGRQMFAFRHVVATDDVVDVVTELCQVPTHM